MSTLHKRTRQRPRLEVVPAQSVPGPCCAAARQLEGALLHSEIALRTYSAGVTVDWADVVYRMTRTLLHAGGEEADAEDDQP